MLTTQIIGHLGFDAKTETPTSGQPYVRFSVAVNQKRNDQETTQWCTVFTRQMNLAQYLRRGTQVYVSGNLSMKAYQAKNGGHEVGVSINANTIQLLGAPKVESQQEDPVPPAFPKEKQLEPQTAGVSTTDESDDIPF